MQQQDTSEDAYRHAILTQGRLKVRGNFEQQQLVCMHLRLWHVKETQQMHARALHVQRDAACGSQNPGNTSHTVNHIHHRVPAILKFRQPGTNAAPSRHKTAAKDTQRTWCCAQGT